MTLRRPFAFVLIPLSALPLAAGIPLVAPSVEKRVQELRGQATEQHAQPTGARVDTSHAPAPEAPDE